MKLKEKDFIEIEYTGKLEDGTIFDTTDEKIAKDAGIANENSKFGPVVICLGANHILKGIEEKLLGKTLGEYEITVTPEKGFGKKNAKLLTLVPMRLFLKENIKPFPGMEVNIDNRYGIVRSVSGGRVIVDFNHPLAGRVLKYKVSVKRVVKEPLEKARAIFNNEFNVDLKLEFKEGKLLIEEKIPKEVFETIKKRIQELIPEIKEIVLVSKKKEEKKK